MPVLSPFSSLVGSDAGRVPPVNAEPFLGFYVFVLGSDAPGVKRRLSVGDFFEVSQNHASTLAGANLIRLRAHVRPAPMTGDLSWKFSILFDGTKAFETQLYRELDLLDLAIPVWPGYDGIDVPISARLELFGTAGEYDVELPAVYLDALILDSTSTGPVLTNRDPGPGEIGVPVNRSIRLEIDSTDPDTWGVSDTATKVYVNGVLAFDGGTFQAGFTGPESTWAADVQDGSGLRIVIDPTTNFGSQQLVSVRVVTEGTPSGGSLDQTYTFTTEDIVAPTVISALAIERDKVRVTFSEALDPDEADDPDNYTITIASVSLDDGLPAVALNVTGAEIETSSTVILTTDIEMTRGALYRLTVSNVEDTSGNAIGVPNTAFFVGFECPPPAGRRFLTTEMVPQANLDEDDTQDLARWLAVLQEVIDLLLCDVDRWTQILDVDRAAERFVDAMLYDLGNPFPFELSEIDKRRLVYALVPIYKKKGTADGIIEAIRFFLGVEVTLSYPAFDDVWLLGVDELGVGSILGSSVSSDRYSYYIVSPIVLMDLQREQMRKIAEYMHPAHEHLRGFTEPSTPPPTPDHWELGRSELGTESILH